MCRLEVLDTQRTFSTILTVPGTFRNFVTQELAVGTTVSLGTVTRVCLLFEVGLALSIGDAEDVGPFGTFRRTLDLTVPTKVRDAVVFRIGTVTELLVAVNVRTVDTFPTMEAHMDRVLGIVLDTDLTNLVRSAAPEACVGQRTVAEPPVP